jgi:hypothetical protein
VEGDDARDDARGAFDERDRHRVVALLAVGLQGGHGPSVPVVAGLVHRGGRGARGGQRDAARVGGVEHGRGGVVVDDDRAGLVDDEALGHLADERHDSGHCEQRRDVGGRCARGPAARLAARGLSTSE